MRPSWRKWGVSVIAWAGVLALGGAALAGVVKSETTPGAWVSPPGVVEGTTLDSAEPFEMTLHLEADPDAAYDLQVVYGGDDSVGLCQTDSATLETDPEGKATFTCDFATVENSGTEPLTGTVTFDVDADGSDVTEVVASLTVRPAEDEEPEAQEEEAEEEVEATDGEAVENHGHCVSFWARESREQGLAGRARGAFVSSIAQDSEAVALKDEPGDGCDFQDELDEALVEQAEAEEAGDAEAGAAGQDRGEAARNDNAKGPNAAGDDSDEETGEEEPETSETEGS